MRNGTATLLIIAGLLVLVFPAEARLRLAVQRIENSRREPFSADQILKPVWITREGNVRVLYLLAQLKSPQFAGYDQVRMLSKSNQAMLKGDKLLMRLDGLTDKVLLSGKSGKLVLEVTAQPDDDPVLDENCRSLQLVLQPIGKAIPFFAGTSCHQSGGAVDFALTLPREADFTSSTLFETKGKGERYRYYELSKIQVAAGSIGKFSVVYQGRSYDLDLHSLLSSSSKIKEPPREMLIAALGYAMLKISGSDIDASDAKPLLRVKVPHYPISGGFGVSANVDFGVPLGSSDTSIAYRQFELYGAYEVSFGPRWLLRPKLGYVVFSQSHAGSGIGLDANQVGFGAMVEYAVSEKFGIQLDAMMCGLGSAVTKSHYALEVGFLRHKTGTMGWGLGARLQSYRAAGEAGVERQFGQTLFFGLITF